MIVTRHLRSRELTCEGFLEDTLNEISIVGDVEGIRHNVTNNDDGRHPTSSPGRWLRVQFNNRGTINDSRHVELSNRTWRQPSVTINKVRWRSLSLNNEEHTLPIPNIVRNARSNHHTAHQNHPTAGISRHYRQSFAGLQPIQGHH